MPQRGDLRRLNAREYYAREEMTKGIMAKLRPFLEEGLWKKLDRGRPVTGAQAEKIRLALNRMAIASKGWPLSWPVVRLAPGRLGSPELRYVEIDGIRKVGTPDGVVYMPAPGVAVSAAGRTGPVGFSSHAIDQWMGRTEGACRDVAMALGQPGLVRGVLASVVRDGAVESGAGGGLFLAEMHKGEAIGYFPLAACEVDGGLAWVCKTFLTPEMRRA